MKCGPEEEKMGKLRILIVTPELAKVVPVGGIAEYALGLASALSSVGHDVRVAVPGYAYIHSDAGFRLEQVIKRLPVKLGIGFSEISSVQKLSVRSPGEEGRDLPVYVLGSHKHFSSVSDARQVYQWPNHEPWVAFSRSIIDFLAVSDWHPDVLHCQDAHTALVPVFVENMRDRGTGSAKIRKVRTVLTIHNLLNQGIGEPGLVSYAGLPQSLFNMSTFEYYGSANCFKAGMLAADRVNTVSLTYAQEICSSSDFGFGLEGVLRQLRSQGRLVGIVNGIDESRWRVEGVQYDGSEDDLDTVLRFKQSLRDKMFKKWNWQKSDKPVIAFRGRWDNQKGVTLLVKQLLDLARVVLVTWGTPGEDEQLVKQWANLQRWSKDHPQDLIINPEEVSSVEQTDKHYAIADFFLMPSKYEPCGLTQMECQRYGTLPIVRKTGGLADTVSQDETPTSPNGFVFENMTPGSMLDAVKSAVEVFQEKERMRGYIGNALLQRNAWSTRIDQYVENLYT